MTPVPIFRAKAKPDGTIIFHDNTAFRRHVKTLASLDVVEVIVRKPEVKRSNKSNRYYRLIVDRVADELVDDPENIHQGFAFKFLRIGNLDDPLPRRRSTASLTQDEFTAYVDKVKAYAATELGIVVPEPNQVDFRQSAI